MVRTVRWGALVAVLGGLCAFAAAAENYDEDVPRLPPGHAAFNKWGGHMPVPPKAKTATPATQADLAAKQRAADTAAAVRRREEANLMRRMDVCDRVKALALETGDERLAQEAEAEVQRAKAVYDQRTAHLPFAKRVNDK